MPLSTCNDVTVQAIHYQHAWFLFLHGNRYGGDNRIIAHQTLQDLFLRQIPKERIHFGKKILSTQQGGNGVIIRCSDRSEYEGDILVGADGAHSAVRQNLYTQLKKEMKLPPSDDMPLPFSAVCLLGQTRPLTTEEFPHLAHEMSQFYRVLGDNKPYVVSFLLILYFFSRPIG
jgi:2-polyprenyl-6-methoxyphenol hydroxylase-like FAD-dependent oxidoreductase